MIVRWRDAPSIVRLMPGAGTLLIELILSSLTSAVPHNARPTPTPSHSYKCVLQTSTLTLPGKN